MPPDLGMSAGAWPGPQADDAPVAQDGDLCLRISVPATPTGVRRALGRIVAALPDRLGRDDLGMLELVLAELLNNIVEHAFAGRRPLPVDIEITLSPGLIAARIEDLGRPIPGGLPAPRPFPDIDLPDAALPEGGFGWPLVHTLVDSIAYRRIGAVNRTEFRMLRGTTDAALPQSCRKDSASLPEMSPTFPL